MLSTLAQAIYLKKNTHFRPDHIQFRITAVQPVPSLGDSHVPVPLRSGIASVRQPYAYLGAVDVILTAKELRGQPGQPSVNTQIPLFQYKEWNRGIAFHVIK